MDDFYRKYLANGLMVYINRSIGSYKLFHNETELACFNTEMKARWFIKMMEEQEKEK